MTIAQSKIWMILDKTRTNAWWDNMMSNNSEWKEKFRLSQPTPRFFLAAFCFSGVVKATNGALHILS